MRYANVTTWARHFEKHEGVKIDYGNILNRLRDAGKTGKSGRDRIGRTLNCSFFSESDVYDVCTELLTDIPQASKSGFFEREGEKWGTIGAWTRMLHISKRATKRYLEESNSKPIKGKWSNGNRGDFYSESDIRSDCADLLEKLPQADELGFFEKDGKKYGAKIAWSRILLISRPAISEHLKKSRAIPIKGKDGHGHRLDFYSESDVRSACADLLEKLPQADELGFFEKDGKKYGTTIAWSRVLPISDPSIKKYLKKFKIRPIAGRVKGSIANFYSESDVRAACADLLEKRNPHAA